MRPQHLTDALMPFGEHLDELRRRLILALVGVLPIFIVSLFYGKTLLGVMVQPLVRSQEAAGLAVKMQLTEPLEAFNTYLKVSFIATVVVGSPWILYQIWLFVAPGLHLVERRFVHILAPMSTVLTVAGVVFMFKVMLPVMLLFFVSFGTDIAPRQVDPAPLPAGVTLPVIPVLDGDPVNPPLGTQWINRRLGTQRTVIGLDATGHPEIRDQPLQKNALLETQYRLAPYIGLLLGLTLAFAVAFQMPVAVLLLGWVGIVEPRTLSKYRRHAVFVCALAGAIVTPSGDPVSMSVLAVPLYALYEMGMLMLRIMPASRIISGARAKEQRKRAAGAAVPKPAADVPPQAAAPHEQPVVARSEADADDEGP